MSIPVGSEMCDPKIICRTERAERDRVYPEIADLDNIPKMLAEVRYHEEKL
jgi:hypothetical protein